ncbi:MAG: hypothetical protein DRP74_06240 [Candidatus Omnitrophota bacterium]|nr:MAG: hypothetical protein DRP74_06240 [Candidatus Omnitrophota bacterium]
MKTTGEIINIISEKFKEVDVKTVDSKNRISLGEKVLRLFTKVDAFKVFVGKEGDILLRPMVNIPSREAWIYQNPKVLNQIRQGLAEAQQGKTEKAEDLDDFLEGL